MTSTKAALLVLSFCSVTSLRAGVAAPRSAPVVLMARTHSASGPAISKDGHKRKKLNVRLEEIRLSKEALRKKRPRPMPRMVSAKRQWDRHKQLVKDGAQPWGVYARLATEQEWLPVGNVTFSEGDAAAAATLHKRLILEHVVRLHPLLQLRRDELQCGVQAGPDAASDVVELEPTEQTLAAASCGFVGIEDAASGYYCEVRETAAHVPEARADTKDRLSGTKLDSKSAVAIQHSETLALRGRGS